MSLSDFLDPLLGSHIDANGQLRYTCPFCGSPKQKFYINNDETSNKFGLWICYNCEEHGNLTSLYMRLKKVSFKQAQDDMFNAGISMDSIPYNNELTNNENIMLTLGKPAQVKEHNIEANRLSPPELPYGLKYFNGSSPNEIPYWNYLERRGFNRELILSQGFGYVESGYAISSRGKRIPIQKHVVFFSYDSKGNYTYWNTRSITNSIPKSINAPQNESGTAITREDVVFGLNYASKQPVIIITEGVPDALTLYPYGVGTFGKQVTDRQIKLIIDSIQENQKILVMLDMDASDLLVKLGRKLYDKHKETYLVYNPTGKDANSLGRDKAFEVIKRHTMRADPVSSNLFLLNKQ
ncbi:DNA primase [Lactobacillus phage Lbab1]|nr:DNA primase [Lactobacillus phage Lbab1]